MNILRLPFLVSILLFTFIASGEETPLKSYSVSETDPWPAAGTTISLPSRPHPRLFLSRTDFEGILQKAKSHTWADKELKNLLARADEALSRTLIVPEKPAEWSQHYICKDCGIKLDLINDRNVCPRCGREYQGWPYDGVIAGRKHIANFADARNLGLAYQFTGNAAYAEKCRSILVSYADRYLGFPIHDYRGGKDRKGGRLFAQTLDESVHFIQFVWAYDLIHDAAVLSPADHQLLQDKLFRPLALTIRRNNMTVSNWQTWHNAATAAIGYTLGDASMVDYAINGSSGIRFQLTHSVLPDGFWYEGTPTYHAYSLSAMQYQVMAMRAAGDAIYQDPVYKSLYGAPLRYAWPNGNFPTVNDSETLSIRNMEELYEVAFAWYQEPAFAVPLSAPRSSETALLFGVDDLPVVPPPPAKSTLFPGLGAVILRSEDMAAHLDYGPHGGAHGHFDKLGVILFANGTDAMPDPGRLDYAAPLHTQWYKNSLAHNTVIVDGKNQEQAEGHLVSSHFEDNINLATAGCDSAYKDVALTRSLALAPAYLLDVVSASSPTSHTWDLAWHARGTAHSSLGLSPIELPQKSDGYEILKNVRAVQHWGKGPAQFTFTRPETSAPLNLDQWAFSAGGKPANPQIILADGFTDRAVTTCPVVLSRVEGTRVCWVSLVSILPPGKLTCTVNSRDDGSIEITIQTNGRAVRYGQINDRRDVYRVYPGGEITMPVRLRSHVGFGLRK